MVQMRSAQGKPDLAAFNFPLLFILSKLDNGLQQPDSTPPERISR